MNPQCERVITMLAEGTLDYQEAEKMGVQRLSAVVSECRSHGWKISQTMKGGVLESGKKIQYAVYNLDEGKKECRRREEEALWECKCPMCGRLHQKYLFWTGNGMPRFYCKRCSEVVS
jgi:hypothetical protein